MNIFKKLLFPSTGFISQEPYNPAAKRHKHYSPQKRNEEKKKQQLNKKKKPHRVCWWF